MNRPDNLMAYDELDLKLGIKSSLPHVKGTLALSVLLWECADHPSELVFSEQKDKETVLTQELRQWLSDYLSEICEEENIDIQKVISCAIVIDTRYLMYHYTGNPLKSKVALANCIETVLKRLAVPPRSKK